ncbi:GerMN domain-containing protein [Actinospongicola halichondriae]|uniref:GerMN domain-containing protein n=1 Tax=Actinospongicola halichondriae TaxID=3236844 RepID=UPI003D444759
MRRHLVTLLVLIAVSVGACAVSTNDEPIELSSDLFESLLETTSTTSATSTPSEVTKTEDVYLLRVRSGSTSLEQVPREVDVDAGIQEVLGNLFTVRPDSEGVDRPEEAGLTTAIPETAELVGATLSPGTTTLVVDVRGLFGAGGIQGSDLRDALAQIVWTATNGEVSKVVFRNDGSPVPAAIDNGETTDQPVDRNSYSAQR